ncbi:hypothetical protein BU17DRAFT_69877 [Hysterangium stoloniferum]|nr:hypothetical protein BU17DRAFT_69877 [Hysterangium stoloniferum]
MPECNSSLVVQTFLDNGVCQDDKVKRWWLLHESSKYAGTLRRACASEKLVIIEGKNIHLKIATIDPPLVLLTVRSNKEIILIKHIIKRPYLEWTSWRKIESKDENSRVEINYRSHLLQGEALRVGEEMLAKRPSRLTRSWPSGETLGEIQPTKVGQAIELPANPIRRAIDQLASAPVCTACKSAEQPTTIMTQHFIHGVYG